MILAKLKALTKIFPPSRRVIERSEETLVKTMRDQSASLRKEILLLQAEIRTLRGEIAGLREKDIAGLAAGVRKEITELREKDIAGLAVGVREEIAGLREKDIAGLAAGMREEIAELREKDIAGLAVGVRKEIAELREKDIAGLAAGVREEIAGLREKDIAGLAERIKLFNDQFDFQYKHLCKAELEETVRKGIIPLRFYKNVDPARKNWGDELNVNLFEAISNGKVKVIRTSDKKSTDLNILPIGSICSELNWGSVIWGAGLISEDFNPHSFPVEVRAVRGPLTRKVLLGKGIDCPAVYGDPALLLPLFYQPVPTTHHRVTIVPHYVDADSEVIAQFREIEGVHVIDMKNYDDWRDVIDAIVNSDFVISSSLHGLVVAEAYGIPSLWVEFSDKILGKWFKYRDFYESIGKKGMKPVRIGDASDFEMLLESKKQWQRGTINVEPLLKSCPFPIVNRVAGRNNG